MSRTKLKNPLVKTVIISGVTLSSFAMVMRQSIDNKMKSTSSYQEAMKILRSDKFSREYLGEPIVEKYVNFLSRANYGTEGKIRWILFGVEGPKKQGYFKYWFSSDNEGNHQLLKVALLNTTYENVFEKYITPKQET